MLNHLREYISRIPSELSYRINLIRHASKLPALSPQDQSIVDTVRNEGVFVTSLENLGLPNTSTLLKAAKNELSNMEALLSAGRGGQSNFGSIHNLAYPQIFTVTDLPEFQNWGSEQRLLNIVENYIGLPIAFQGVHLRRDFANEEPVTTELWHLDAEDRRMVKVIIYLDDVSVDHGPFEYIPKSKVSLPLALRIRAKIASRMAMGKVGLNDAEMEELVPRSMWKPCPGTAGSVVFADPKAIFHHGKSRKKGRSALFFVYTAKNPLRPECCTQYSDQTFPRVILQDVG